MNEPDNVLATHSFILYYFYLFGGGAGRGQRTARRDWLSKWVLWVELRCSGLEAGTLTHCISRPTLG